MKNQWRHETGKREWLEAHSEVTSQPEHSSQYQKLTSGGATVTIAEDVEKLFVRYMLTKRGQNHSYTRNPAVICARLAILRYGHTFAASPTQPLQSGGEPSRNRAPGCQTHRTAKVNFHTLMSQPQGWHWTSLRTNSFKDCAWWTRRTRRASR